MSRKLTFSHLGKYGRLGNQLFQIASTMGIAKKNGMIAGFPRWKYARYFAPVPELGKPQKPTLLKERYYHHHDWQIPSRGDYEIQGYLQSEKYWEGEDCPVKLRKGFIRMVREKHAQILLKPAIGIHIRRGDYVGNANYKQLNMGYFLSALIEHFPDWESYNLVIFSDDMDYCRVHLSCLNNVFYTDRLNDIESLGLMSQMHGVIMSNSSFSWWGSYFAEQNGAKIVRPSKHFDGKLATQCDIRDLYPERWTVHDADSRIDLKDTTFTIPVAYDHPDREQNLALCLNHLGRDFVTNVMIEEQGKVMKFEHFRSYQNVIGVEHFKSTTFHRTAMLNNMAKFAKTDIVANWDADVLVPPMQIYLAVKAIRNGAGMVYPYGGVFARMPRKIWLKKLQQQDIGVVRRTIFPGMTEGFESVGGAVLFHRETFLRFGGENENFISYGAEDVERAYRFPKLGVKMVRIPGALYHVDHWIGPNSSKENPHFDGNEREWARIQKLSEEKLRKEFDRGA